MAEPQWIFPNLYGIERYEAKGIWWPIIVYPGLPDPDPFPCEPTPINKNAEAWARWNGRSRAQQSFAKDWLERLQNAQSFLKPNDPTHVEIIVDAIESAWMETVRNDEYQKGMASWEGNMAEARDHFEEAALNGHPGAQSRFASMCDEGIGGPVDQAKARRWHLEASKNGVLQSLNDYAWMCAHGEGGKVDHGEARRAMTEAAEAGLDMAQDNLATWYREGFVLEKDLNLARHWYQRAAEQGIATCQEWMGIFLVNGWGGTKDGHEAIQWFEKAGPAGRLDSYFYIFAIYFQGEAGVAPDRGKAAHWMRVACEAGSPKALQWMKERGTD